MRNFVTGILWGGVLAVGGLAVVSQMTLRSNIPADPVAELPAVEPAKPKEGAAPEAAGTVEVAAPEIPATSAEAPQGLIKAPEDTDEPLLRPMAEAEAPPPAAVVPDMQAPVIVAQAPRAEPGPEAAPQPIVEEAKPAETVPEQALASKAAIEPVAKAAPEAAGTAANAPAPEGVPATDPAKEPAAEAIAEAAESAIIEPAPEGGPANDPAKEPVAEAAPEGAGSAVTDPAPAEEPAVEAAAAAPAEPLPSTLTLDSELGETAVDGVTTGRLPSIGAPDSAPVDGAVATPSPDVELPPVKRFARNFENPEGKPLFAILLVDPGTAEVKRAELAALPFAVSFVLDPLAPGAAEAAAIYRAAGQEVIMLATGIPKGAKASDLEQSFAGLERALPEAVALIDTADATFQDDRILAAEVVTLLAAQGRGLVTFDRGLNAADQVARREALPAATIFRNLDQEGEDAPVIRRYLDRAAFKAAQEGKVVVIGTARESTIAALMAWTVEGRASSVALAPLTAVMSAE